jgi:mono/diheme cytochrome c family protein/RNAse (barnase) inhibitor barstar
MNIAYGRRRAAAGLAVTTWVVAVTASRSLAAEAAGSAGFAAAQPLLARYCIDCHSGDAAEGEVNLSFTHDAATLGKHAKLLQRVEDMVTSGQMPPPESDQPTDEERRALGDWLRAFLTAEALAHAGDPGRVVLRRLNNAEYTHTIRDLTGVDSLDPVKEFPADGGAGEGFTNTGQSLVMSPSLATKYLDAAKGIAAHTVVLPDGLRFSAGDSRRDFADEALVRIKQFYARYTQSLDAAAAAAQQTVKHGVKLDTGHDGFLPVEKYLLATLAERERLGQGVDAVAAVARERGLSPKYLATLFAAFSAPEAAPAGDAAASQPSLILDALRACWKSATPDNAAALTAAVSEWQTALWKFNAAGGIVSRFNATDGPAAWMEAATPLVERQEFRVKLSVPKDKHAVTIRLAAGDASDGRDHDVVVWRNPRLVAPGRADLPLSLVRPMVGMLAAERERLAATAAECLAAVAEAQAGPEVTAAGLEATAAELAQKHAVDPRLLAGWLSYLGIGAPEAAFAALLDKKLEKVEGWEAVNGWRGEGALRVVANSSDEQYRIPGTVHPHGVAVHPDVKHRVVVGWRSPITGTIEIRGATASAHQGCTNGTAWSVEVWRGKTRETLTSGASHGAAFGPFGLLSVRRGDMVAVVVGAHEGDHNCDLTRVDLTIRSGDREWDLARDVSGDILIANPHADGQGNANIWHFAAEPEGSVTGWTIPAGSQLARWMAAAPPERAAIAADLERLLAGDGTKLEKDSPDAQLLQLLRSATGPLLAGIKLPQDKVASADEVGEQAVAVGLDTAIFGRHPQGLAVDPGDLCLQAPDSITITIPAELAEGCEFVTEGTLHPNSPAEASVQLEVATNASGDAAAVAGLVASLPVVACKDSTAWRLFEKAFADVRDLFPKAVCYGRIVPVDEVVTMNLYYREDDQLRRLMLSDTEAKELDRLWDELLFIAQEPLEFEDVFEQFNEYAGQIVDEVEPLLSLKPAIAAYAEAFRKRLVEVEPRHLDAVVAFAGRAFRRPLAPAEESRLRTLYDTLRKKEVAHEDAIRALVAHVLVSADFLYKIEVAGPGTEAKPVSDYELATRLSYFLWSSMPDAELLAAAASGRLHDQEVLKSEVRRMLAARASRRLAEEFGTQWLHVHGFSALDEKNAELFPTFADLRADMEEETVRFLDDFFRNDRSILSLIDADYTFLNERLAKHYGIEGVTGDAWRRVEGVRKHGRGSILCLATTLSTQAGASRTSPILRGNWLYETILGEKLPKPPKDVPLLAETVPTGLSERQLIAMHSENAACAKCHRRIDPFGFALEEFDAIGRLRSADASGKPLDTKATLPDGATLDGQESVREYLLGPRRDQFVRVFCRKLLGYALGRGVQLSDQPLLDEMAARLAAADYKISVAIEAIVTSPQFLSIRGRDAADDAT